MKLHFKLKWVVGVVGIIACALVASPVYSKDDPKAVSIFKENKCNECHAWTSQGIGKPAKAAEPEEGEGAGKEAPDVSKLSQEVSKSANVSEFLKDFLKKKTELNKKKHRKRFKGSDEELDEMVKFIVEHSKK